MIEQEAKDEIARVLGPLPPKSQRRVARKMLHKYRDKIDSLNLKVEEKKEYLSVLEELQSWLNDNDEPILEKNDVSRLHKFLEAFPNGKIITDEGLPDVREYPDIQHTFVVKHDWSAALGGVEDGDVRLPYELCAFEFRICGRTVIAMAVETDQNEHGMIFTVLVEAQGYWMPFCDSIPKEDDSLSQFVWNQIQAICVALDAEVAVDEVQRAPYKLNQKREKAGKRPLADFHVVDLAKRHRVSNPSYGESGTKKRLHFRRGHWRHYEDSKTWVKWCLVGDPDLGFISKEYSI